MTTQVGNVRPSLSEFISNSTICDTNGSQGTCLICLGDYQQTENPPVHFGLCGHRFHKSCANIWFLTHNICPMCCVHVYSKPDLVQETRTYQIVFLKAVNSITTFIERWLETTPERRFLTTMRSVINSLLISFATVRSLWTNEDRFAQLEVLNELFRETGQQIDLLNELQESD
jgi:hypothetical protein